MIKRLARLVPLPHVKRPLRYLYTSVKEIVPWRPEDGLPVPPPALRDKVRKGQMTRAGFVREGRDVFETLCRTLRQAGIPLTASTSVYEFGCGCGRVARHFLHSGIDYHGSDVDAQLIAWARDNLSPDRFHVNAYTPPTSLEDERFDVCLAISVFTHIPPAQQRAWLDELTRVLRPGGVIVLSFKERDDAADGGVLVVNRPDPGIRRQWLGQGAAPPEYLDVFHTRDYIASNWSDPLRVQMVIDGAIRGVQSLAVLRKPARSP